MPRRTKKQENDTINGDRFFEYFLNKNDDFEELDSLLSECEYYNTNCIFGAGKYELPADLLEKLNCSTQETRDDIHSAMKMLVRLRQMMRKCRRDSINITELFGLWLSPDYHWRKVKKAFPDESSFSKTYRVSFQYAEKYFLHARELMFRRPELLFGSAKRAICEFISKYKAKGNDFFESERDVYHFILYTYQQFPTFVRVLTSVYNDRQNVITAANRAFKEYNAELTLLMQDAVSELHELVRCDFDVESAKVALENYACCITGDGWTQIPFHVRTQLFDTQPPFKVSPESCLQRGKNFVFEAIEKFRIEGHLGDDDAVYRCCILQGELWHVKHHLAYELLPLLELARRNHLGSMFFLGLKFPRQQTLARMAEDIQMIWDNQRDELINSAAKMGHSLAISYLELAKIDEFINPKYTAFRSLEPYEIEEWESRARTGEFEAMVTLIRTYGGRDLRVEYFEKLLERLPCRESEFLLGQFLVNRKVDELLGVSLLERLASESHVGALKVLAKLKYEKEDFSGARDLWQHMMELNWGLHYPSFQPCLSADYAMLAALDEGVILQRKVILSTEFQAQRDCLPITDLKEFPGILEFEEK